MTSLEGAVMRGEVRMYVTVAVEVHWQGKQLLGAQEPHWMLMFVLG